MRKLANLFILMSSLALCSCGGSSDSTPEVKDTIKPTIISITAPTAGVEINASSVLKFEAKVSDNEALASYKLSIKYHSALKSTYTFEFDTDTNTTDAEGNPFPTIEGKSSTISFNIKLVDGNSKVPADGNYTLSLVLKDKANNSISKEFDFIIKQ